MLTNLGQALSKAPPMQLAAMYVMVPQEFIRSAVQDAVRYMINQLSFADKVWALPCADYMSRCWVFGCINDGLCLMHDGIICWAR